MHGGRSAHQALAQAQPKWGQGDVAYGREIVGDLDREKFFDRVNHDIVMARLARRRGPDGVMRRGVPGIGDKRLLKIADR